MPPQVYIANLKPLETTDGLAFDPLSKDFIRIDVRDPKEKSGDTLCYAPKLCPCRKRHGGRAPERDAIDQSKNEQKGTHSNLLKKEIKMMKRMAALLETLMIR